MKKNRSAVLIILILSAFSAKAQIDYSRYNKGVFPDSAIVASMQLNHEKLLNSLITLTESYYCIIRYSIAAENDLLHLEIIEDSKRPLPAILKSHVQKLLELATNELSYQKTGLFVEGKHSFKVEFRKKGQSFNKYEEDTNSLPWFYFFEAAANQIDSYSPGAEKWLYLYY